MIIFITWAVYMEHENIMTMLSSLINPMEQGPSWVVDEQVKKILCNLRNRKDYFCIHNRTPLVPTQTQTDAVQLQ